MTSAQFAYGLINIGKSVSTGKRLYQEVKEISDSEEEIDYYARRTDTFLNQVYLEILRSNPPICKTHPSLLQSHPAPDPLLTSNLKNTGFTFPETTAMEKRIDGYLIPAGTNVLIDTLRLNKSSPLWGDTGHDFCPERWEHITPSQARYSFLGYGMGPRKCLGKNFANIILKLFLITVSQHFELHAGEGAIPIKRDRFTCMPEQLVVFEQRV